MDESAYFQQFAGQDTDGARFVVNVIGCFSNRIYSPNAIVGARCFENGGESYSLPAAIRAIWCYHRALTSVLLHRPDERVYHLVTEVSPRGERTPVLCVYPEFVNG